MSGHSKWSTIKRKKGALDAKRSKIFSKIVKEIIIAVKEGGNSDVETNPKLRMAVANAKGANMPKDNVLKAINKAEKDPETLTEQSFEGYAPGGVAIFVECLTDNSNRTVSNIRAIFNKRSGSLGTNGSLDFLFERKGVFTISASKINIEELELDLIDNGAENIETEDDMVIIYTSLEDFGNLQKKLEELKVEVENAELQRIPNNTKKIDFDTAKKVLKMIDAFEEDDDVQNVYHNLEMTDELSNL